MSIFTQNNRHLFVQIFSQLLRKCLLYTEERGLLNFIQKLQIQYFANIQPLKEGLSSYKTLFLDLKSTSIACNPNVRIHDVNEEIKKRRKKLRKYKSFKFYQRKYKFFDSLKIILIFLLSLEFFNSLIFVFTNFTLTCLNIIKQKFGNEVNFDLKVFRKIPEFRSYLK